MLKGDVKVQLTN